MKNNIMNDDDLILKITSPNTYLLETEIINNLPGSLIINFQNKNFSYKLYVSYSFDSTNYSRWFNYESEIEKFFNSIREDFIKGYEIKIQIKIDTEIEEIGNFDIKKQDMEYYFNISKILINNINIEIINKGIINSNDISYSNKTGLWNPYDGMNSALNLYKSISKSMNNVLGIWVYYFKTDPNKDSKNIHLKTFELYSVVGMKKIKVLVPNNKFPSAINIYHEFGIQFPDEFNIHVLNEEFERAFGFDEYPKTKDYLYFPINQIMYEVNAFYKPRTFMEKSIYSELILNKYEDDSTINKNEFENDTFEYLELFDDGSLNEDGFKESQSADPNFLNVELLEASRIKLHKNLHIVENPLTINNITIFTNEYLFSNVLNNELCLQFNAMNQILNNITFSFWIMFEKITPSRTIATITDIQNNDYIVIKLKQQKLEIVINKSYVIETDIKFKAFKQYGIGLSLSTMYNEAELNIIEYNEDSEREKIKNIYNINNDEFINQNTTLKYINFYGGTHLISNIRLDDIKIKNDTFNNYMLNVMPNPETNILFDKAHTAISDDKFNA